MQQKDGATALAAATLNGLLEVLQLLRSTC